MEKPFDFKVAVELAMARNDELIHRYRESSHRVRTPSVGKVLQSILDQKGKHKEILQGILESPDISRNSSLALAQTLLGPAIQREEGYDPATGVLKFVQAEEARLAALYACLRDASRDEDTHQKIRALSEASLKFSGWVKDHLELLELF